MFLAIIVILILILIGFYKPKLFSIILLLGIFLWTISYVYYEFIFTPHHIRFIEANNLTIIQNDENGFPRYAVDDNSYYILNGVNYSSIDKQTASQCRTFNHYDPFSWCNNSTYFMKCYPTDKDCASRSVVVF